LPLSGTVAVTKGDVLSVKGLTFKANAGQALSGSVATFTDRDTHNVASDFSGAPNVSDGLHTQSLALLSQYMASKFRDRERWP
jgi:hypothetical protein